MKKINWFLAAFFSFFLFSASVPGWCAEPEKLQFGPAVDISALQPKGVAVSHLATGRTSLAEGSQSRRLTVKIDPADCRLEKTNGFAVLRIKDEPLSTAPGKPALPLMVKEVNLPAGSEVVGVTVASGVYRPITNRLLLAPAAEPVPLGKEKPGKMALDKADYQQHSYLPGNLVTFFAAPSREQTTLFLRFSPVQYIPAEESAVLITDITVEIRYNTEPVPLQGGRGGSLIICPQRYLRAAEALADFHRSDTGLFLNSRVVTTEYIGSLPYGTPNRPPLAPYPDAFCSQGGFSNTGLQGQPMVAAGGYNGDLARKIASYIQEARNPSDGGFVYLPDLEYIVILGNARDVPPSYYFYSAPEPNNPYMGRDSWIPTDYFYSLSSYGDIVPNYKVGRLSVMVVPFVESLTVTDITPLEDGYRLSVSGPVLTPNDWVAYNIQVADESHGDTRFLPLILANTSNTITVDIDPALIGISAGSGIRIVAGPDYLVDKEKRWFTAAFGDYRPDTFPRDPDWWFYSAGLAGGAPFETWLYWGELDCLSILNGVDEAYDGRTFLANIRTKKYFATDKKDYYRSEGTWDEAFRRADLLPLLNGSGERNGFLYMVGHGSGDALYFDADSFDGRFAAHTTELINADDFLLPGLTRISQLPVFISAGCENGDFDELIWSSTGGKPSLSEALLLSRSGAVAYLGGARSNYIGTDPSFENGRLSWQTSLMPELLRNVFKEYHRRGNTLGTITTKAKIDYLGTYYGTENWDLYTERTLFQNVLQGDPALYIPVRPDITKDENSLPQMTALSPRSRTPSYNDFALPVYEVSRGGTKSITTSFSGASPLELTFCDPRWREAEEKRGNFSPTANYTYTVADRETDAQGSEVVGTVGGPSVYFLRAAVTDPHNSRYTKESRLYYEVVNEFVPQGKILVIDDDQQDRLRFFLYPRDNREYERYYEDALQANGYHRLRTDGYLVWHNDNDEGSNSLGTASSSADFGQPNQGRYGEITPDALQYYNGPGKAVVYFTGDDWQTTLLPHDRTYLDTFLRTGGRLFLTGQDIGWNIGGTSFYRDSLHAVYRQDSIGLYEIDGVAGSPISDSLFDLNINPNFAGGSQHQFSPSEIDAGEKAVPVFFYQRGSGPGEPVGSACAGLSFSDGNNGLVYLPFGFEGIRDFDDAHRGRKQVLGNVLSWLFNPTQTTSFSARPGDKEVLLEWRTPAAADFKGTRIIFRTDREPNAPDDGTVIYNQDNEKNKVYSYLHTGLENGLTYYYAAYWYSTATPAVFTLLGKAQAVPAEGAAVTYTVSGIVRDEGGTGLDGVTLTLKSAGNTYTTVSGSDGTYSFADVPGGQYTLSAAKSGFVFEPAQYQFLLSSDLSGQDFVGYPAYGVSGVVQKSGVGLAGVEVALKWWSGSDTQVVSTDLSDSNGFYQVWGRGEATGRRYTVVPTLAGWRFVPEQQEVTITDTNISGINFTAFEARYDITGKIKTPSGSPLTDVLLLLAGTDFEAETRTDMTGAFQFLRVPAGDYLLTPLKTGFLFTPGERAYPSLGSNQENQDFTAYLELTFTTGPSGNPNPVTRNGLVSCTVTAENMWGEPVTYLWRAEEGYFEDTGLPESSRQNPNWVADVPMPPFVEYEMVRIQVTASSLNSQPKTVYYFQRVNPTTEPIAESGGGGCFIATAAFGSPLADEVGVLRRFRDEVLLRSQLGTAFVRFYYRHSPAVAAYIQPKPAARAFVRMLLRPLIWFAQVLLG